jgi:uncharacterized membrane protein YbhN (UPF0104 family)
VIESGSPTLRHASRLRALRWIAVAVVAVLLAYSLRRLDLSRAWAEMGALRAGWLLAAIACYFAILPLWAIQWQLLAPPDARRTTARMFAVVAMTSTVLNTTPLLVGEATGVVLLVTLGGLTRPAALSVLAMDQLLVGVAKVVVLSSAALLLTLPRWMSGAAAPLVAGVATLLAVLTLGAWRHADLARWADRVVAPRLGAGVGSLGAALAPLRSPGRGGGAMLLALAKKGVEIAAIVCVQHAFGVSLPWAGAILVLACLNLATLVPVVPGNVGVYEAAVVVAYRWLGVAPEQAFGIAIVQHLCYFLALALPGAWWVARGGVRAQSIT